MNRQVEYYSSKKLKSLLSQDVYREILDRLMNNRLVPGDIINRREIANQLGVSVAPGLEALLQLEMEGFLESIPRKGTIIKPIKQEDVYGHLMIRDALECQGVRLYCGELVRKNRDRLIACSEELEKSSTESPEHWKKEIQFHYMLIKLAGCRVLSSELSRTIKLGLFYRIQRTIIPSDRLIRQSHIDLVHRVETDDKDEAEQVISGYSLGRYAFKGKKVVSSLLIISQLFQGPLIMIPWYRMASTLGILNSRLALILIYGTVTIPVSILLMSSFFSKIGVVPKVYDGDKMKG